MPNDAGGEAMSLPGLIKTNLERSMALYEELVTSLDESALAAKLPDIPSNSIGAQLWCVVGARESYFRAAQAGAWSGFTCSLTSTEAQNKAAVLAALTRSAAGVTRVVSNLAALDDNQTHFIVGLLEHEAAHQGQIIRYLYGLGLAIPGGWKAKYAL